MPFAVVNTVEKGQSMFCYCPENWIEDDEVLWWPPRNLEKKVIMDDSSIRGEGWTNQSCEVKFRGVSRESAMDIVGVLVRSNTDNEEEAEEEISSDDNGGVAENQISGNDILLSDSILQSLVPVSKEDFQLLTERVSNMEQKQDQMLKQISEMMTMMHNLTKSHADLLQESADGFWILGDSLLVWDFRKQFVKLQSEYGVSPFVRIRVENRKSAPHDGIIVIDEGEVSLPSKMFYRLSPRHEIIEGFKILLRDVAILMGVVHDRAKQFAEDIFNYEKRIVNTINVTQQNDDREINREITLGSVMKIAPSLPLLDIITTLYPNSRVTENTIVLVRDLEVLRSMSIVVATTDLQVLNMYLVWSLIRRYLPFISRDYRIAAEEFEKKVYGFREPPPKWYFCTKLVRDWMDFGVDALRENPQLIVVHQKDTTQESKVFFSEKFTIDRDSQNDELVKMIFYHLRNELKESVNGDGRISDSLRTYISDHLSAIALQIGIPDDATHRDEFVNNYYTDFTPQRLYFLNNLRHRWKFIKARMEAKLTNQTRAEKLIDVLYPLTEEEDQRFVQFHPGLNTIVVSRKALRRPYFHQNYPISINFARIGKDFIQTIVHAIKFYQESHSRVNTTYRSASSAENKIINDAFKCYTKRFFYDKTSIPTEAKTKLYVDVESNRILVRAFKSFLRHADQNSPIYDSTVADSTTFDDFGLRNRLRQPGLRIYDENQLLVLTQLQRYCGLEDPNAYDRIKVFMEMEFPRKEIFQILWHFVPELSNALSCDHVDIEECGDVL
ncbi:Endothelin-converting enzyme 1 [Sergentomyia squamirostris]